MKEEGGEEKPFSWNILSSTSSPGLTRNGGVRHWHSPITTELCLAVCSSLAKFSMSGRFGIFSFLFNPSLLSSSICFWLSNWSQQGLSTHLSIIPCFLGNGSRNQDEIQHLVLYCLFFWEVCSVFTEPIAHDRLLIPQKVNSEAL